MSACDGSGRAIGCPGCPECRAEMDEIDRNIRELTGLMRGLRRDARAGDPWEQTITDEPDY